MAYFKKELGVVSVAALAAMLAWAPPAFANGDGGVIQRIEELQAELDALRAEAAAARADAAEAREIAENANQTAQSFYSDLNSDTSWRVGGYMAVGFEYNSDADPESTFIFGKVNPIFHFQYKDWVFAEAEIEFEMDGRHTEVVLEYANINFVVNDNMTLVFGKFWNPTTIFNARYHAGWIGRLIDRPVGWGSFGPRDDVGVMVRGGMPIANGARFNYAFAIGNGHRLKSSGIDLHGFATDDNDGKSFSGRLGFLPIPAIEVGVSFMMEELLSHVPFDDTTPRDADFNMYAADAAFTQGPWRIRGEYLSAEISGLGSVYDGGADVLTGDAEWQTWYVQGAFRMSGVTDDPVLGNFEPVVRYGQHSAEGAPGMEDGDEDQLSVGLNYWFAPAIVAHSVVQWRDFDADSKDDETVLSLQLVYGF